MTDLFDQMPEPGIKRRRTIAKAVAIKHQWHGEGTVPKVVAAGMGAFADKILQLAFDTGVKVREDADLVEVLSALDIDAPIPLETYMAVAEILAYVYQANAHAPARGIADA